MIATISVNDNATPGIRAAVLYHGAEKCAARARPAVLQFTKKYLAANGRNKRGWPSTGFWESAARKTFCETVGSVSDKNAGLLLRVEKVGVQQRLRGGPIRPVRAKALAIPVAAESYGKPPSAFGDALKLIVIKGKGAWLGIPQTNKAAYDDDTARSSPKARPRRFKFLYRLSRGVNQDPDPSVFPSDDELLEVAFAGVLRK